MNEDLYYYELTDDSDNTVYATIGIDIDNANDFQNVINAYKDSEPDDYTDFGLYDYLTEKGYTIHVIDAERVYF